jgi:hypothetical protein
MANVSNEFEIPNIIEQLKTILTDSLPLLQKVFGADISEVVAHKSLTLDQFIEGSESIKTTA